MNILVLGSGGREHAIAKKITKSKLLDKLYVMPGNPGTAEIAKNIDGDPMNNREVLVFCISHSVELVIPGSEIYLQNGIADVISKHGIHVFGPKKAAAKIESSKQFAKKLMKKYDIPTATYNVFDEYQSALEYLDQVGVPIVIKYDGLAGGKGVVVAKEYIHAKAALSMMLEQKVFGDKSVIIEEYLEGPEFSFMCFVDQGQVIPMPIAQDHKRLLDNEQGPNTGGMGIYTGVPIIPKEVIETSFQKIMQRTVDALISEGIKYTGFLYGGLMYTNEGPKVIEFNARFGDPEAEVILPRLKTDLVRIIMNLKEGRKMDIKWSNEFILGVVLASKGYPNAYEKGFLIEGLDNFNEYLHMGTKLEHTKLVTNGGRVLFVYGRGKTLLEAKNNAYENIDKVKCSNLTYRKDIGWRSL